MGDPEDYHYDTEEEFEAMDDLIYENMAFESECESHGLYVDQLDLNEIDKLKDIWREKEELYTKILESRSKRYRKQWEVELTILKEEFLLMINTYISNNEIIHREV